MGTTDVISTGLISMKRPLLSVWTNMLARMMLTSEAIRSVPLLRNGFMSASMSVRWSLETEKDAVLGNAAVVQKFQEITQSRSWRECPVFPADETKGHPLDVVVGAHKP